ncbi:hypothetical protein M501DRAFT_857119 [Patellaria atrata CBS 101060]|uniref:Zn(2)-C6 fungal-type domain-containing protein n=1 Tax=Patellaria atrata CBS 101060 TaxID=1346257 RepID=A0A9P4SAS9_9PEZI|nr:hypothetical protein M501DRAFT_857119 [Patellaria atrata CBS 101060]
MNDVSMSQTPNNASSSAPPPKQVPSAQHTRTYQACIPCRRRKVRCDLGPVDDPHEPPCKRCKREGKDCFFSATRRKKRPTDAGEELDDGDISDYEARNGRKKIRASVEDGLRLRRSNSSQTEYGNSKDTLPTQPLTPGGSVGRYQPLRRPGSNTHVSHENDEEDQKVNNETAAMLQRSEIYSGHDALNLLYEAAGRNGDFNGLNSSPRHVRNGSNTVQTPGSQGSYASPQTNIYANNYPGQRRSVPEPVIDPAITNGTSLADEAAYESAVKAWTKFRFVRAGWFTAKEAIGYIDYFYTFLSPLTPIVVPDYRHPSKHASLLIEEPMLVVTLLTIASRYMKLPGPGSASRPYAIHEKLWAYLQGMIDRMIWGQEQFGGGLCGAGAQPASDVNPLTRRGLRTLGTIESLMLLTEWHPRALHFPPSDDDDELVTPDIVALAGLNEGSTTEAQDEPKAVGGQRINSWLEPCWRSDRMCWMLLGNAMSLAFEIGVFDEMRAGELAAENPNLSHQKVMTYIRRRDHLRDLILIYVTQTSGRVGLTSMLPRSAQESSFLNRSEEYQAKLRNVNRQRVESLTRDRARLSPIDRVSMTQDTVLFFWMEIAALMEAGNQQMFPNRKETRRLIKTGEYVGLLERFKPLLRHWMMDFKQCKPIPDHMRQILTIEYEYCRVYLNSLALQAVVERCTHSTPMQSHAQPVGGAGGLAPKSDGNAIPLSTLMKVYGDDRQYVQEVIDACRSVLRVVVDGLYPDEYLKHVPVRTAFRIISVAIILLKTFALGATEGEVAISLDLMSRAVEALRTCVVDDVHVANRFAELLDTLTNRIRSRFVRMAATGGTGVSRGASRSPMPAVAIPPMMPPPPHTHQGVAQWASSFQNPQPALGSPAPGNGTGTGTQTPNPALWGISTEIYDPNSNIHIMPPPTFDTNNNSFDTNAQASNQTQGFPGFGVGDGEGYMSDWLALPLDPLMNISSDAPVNQTTYGPDVGGYDLLDVLLNSYDGTT